MTMSGKTWAWLIATLLVGVGIGFFIGSYQAVTSINRQIQQQPTGIANPASVHCVLTLGGTSEIRSEDNGQVGYCHLKDGRAFKRRSISIYAQKK